MVLVTERTGITGDHLQGELAPPIGVTAKRALLHASLECRTVAGLAEAVSHLAQAPEEFLFCYMAPAPHGDSVTHMHAVLLEAFCLEHGIYIIKVDSAEKMSKMLRLGHLEYCVLVQRNWTAADHRTEVLTGLEEQLVDYCEEFWDAPVQPLVKLPEK